MKTAELIGDALDWAVAKCENVVLDHGLTCDEEYSTNWAQGGPIIEREFIDVRYSKNLKQWYALKDTSHNAEFGPTYLIAAMRCYVASKLGDEVEIPKEYMP